MERALSSFRSGTIWDAGTVWDHGATVWDRPDEFADRHDQTYRRRSLHRRCAANFAIAADEISALQDAVVAPRMGVTDGSDAGPGEIGEYLSD